jgi:hypothetical protein
MPFQVVHPRDFPAQFGVAKPSRATLMRWRKLHGFPHALEIPRGYYVHDDVVAWFASRPARMPKAT